MPRRLTSFFTQSIRRQLALGIMAVHALLMTLFVYDLVERQRDFLLAQSLGQAHSLAGTLAANSVSWVLAGDVSGLQEVLRAQTRYPHLRYAMLLSPQGRVLGHSDPAMLGLYIKDPVSLTLLRIKSPSQQILQNNALSVDVAEPVLADGQLVGWARVGIGQEHITTGLALVTRNGLIYTAMAILLGTLFALLMARGLTADLQRLSGVAARVRKGNLDERADVRREDEIGVLAAALNRMLDALRERSLENKIAHQRLANSQAEFAAMFRAIPDGVVLTDEQRRVRMANPAAEALFGYSVEELRNLDIAAIYASHEDYEATGQLGCEADGSHYLGEALLRRSDGRIMRGQVLRAPVYDSLNAHVGFIALFRDITEHKAAEERLRLSASVFSHAHEGIMITDAKAEIVEANDSYCKLTGYSLDELRGRNPRLLKSGIQDAAFYREMWQSLLDKGYWHGDVWNRREDGELYAQLTRISAVHNDQGEVCNYICLATDITMAKSSQQMLEKMAYLDPLTQLPNRTLLADRMQQVMAQCQRDDSLLAVCYLDLDGFKPVNDRWGHAAGDRLLIAVAQRLREAVRAGDTVSRIGGDEFVVLLSGLENAAASDQSLRRIHEAIQQPFTLDQGVVQISASLGVSLFPLDSSDPDTLLRHADQAMYQAKQSGRNRIHLFDPEHDRRTRSRIEVQARVRKGLAEREFRLYYQPKVDMLSGGIIGAEALIRWLDPERGLVLPGEFLPSLEGSELSQDLDLWVLETALRQAGEWLQQGLRLPVSVNLSARLLQAPDFSSQLATLLQRHTEVAPTDMLELEILETIALQDFRHISRLMRECEQLGVRFSLDDFGTGYSSLSYLKHLPAHTLKIDQSFVRDMLTDEEDRAIVQGVIGLAKAFHRQVVAEGVETVGHGVELLRMGCTLGQGYGIAKPMPAADVIEWTRQWRPPVVWREKNSG